MMRLIRLSIVSYLTWMLYTKGQVYIAAMFAYLAIVVEIQTVSINRLWSKINDT